jgi:hypothetical protein
MASTKLKMAVFAPIPMASVNTAMSEKPGLLRSVQKAYLRSRRRVGAKRSLNRCLNSS